MIFKPIQDLYILETIYLKPLSLFTINFTLDKQWKPFYKLLLIWKIIYRITGSQFLDFNVIHYKQYFLANSKLLLRYTLSRSMTIRSTFFILTVEFNLLHLKYIWQELLIILRKENNLWFIVFLYFMPKRIYRLLCFNISYLLITNIMLLRKGKNNRYLFR